MPLSASLVIGVTIVWVCAECVLSDSITEYMVHLLSNYWTILTEYLSESFSDWFTYSVNEKHSLSEWKALTQWKKSTHSVNHKHSLSDPTNTRSVNNIRYAWTYALIQDESSSHMHMYHNCTLALHVTNMYTHEAMLCALLLYAEGATQVVR